MNSWMIHFGFWSDYMKCFWIWNINLRYACVIILELPLYCVIEFEIYHYCFYEVIIFSWICYKWYKLFERQSIKSREVLNQNQSHACKTKFWHSHHFEKIPNIQRSFYSSLEQQFFASVSSVFSFFQCCVNVETFPCMFFLGYTFFMV